MDNSRKKGVINEKIPYNLRNFDYFAVCGCYKNASERKIRRFWKKFYKDVVILNIHEDCLVAILVGTSRFDCEIAQIETIYRKTIGILTILPYPRGYPVDKLLRKWGLNGIFQEYREVLR